MVTFKFKWIWCFEVVGSCGFRLCRRTHSPIINLQLRLGGRIQNQTVRHIEFPLSSNSQLKLRFGRKNFILNRVDTIPLWVLRGHVRVAKAVVASSSVTIIVCSVLLPAALESSLLVLRWRWWQVRRARAMMFWCSRVEVEDIYATDIYDRRMVLESN